MSGCVGDAYLCLARVTDRREREIDRQREREREIMDQEREMKEGITHHKLRVTRGLWHVVHAIAQQNRNGIRARLHQTGGVESGIVTNATIVGPGWLQLPGPNALPVDEGFKLPL